MEVLVFEPQEKTWGYSSFRFGGRVQTNFDDDNNFQFMLQHTLGWLNSWGGELRTEAQIGEKVSFSMQLYQPIGTASPFYLLPRIYANKESYDLYNGDNRSSSWQNKTAAASLELGYEIGRLGTISAGTGYFTLRNTRTVGNDKLPVPNQSSLGSFINLSLDRLDNVNFPTKGYKLDATGMHFYHDMGTSRSRDTFDASGTAVKTFGPWTVNASLKGGRSSLEGVFKLGGDGELYFGTINGMISFYPEQVRSVNPRFNIALTAIWSNSEYMSPNNEKAFIPSSISELTEITLTHEQAQSLRLEYSGLNYQYTDNTQYAMKMEGIDKDWQFVGNQHQVRFSNLPSGRYILKIKASKDGIHWDETGQKDLAIRVLPPWWLSPGAYLVYALLFLLIIYAAYRYTKTRIILLMRLKTEHEQRVNIENMNQQKINFFTYISHDLKTPLTLILSPLQRLIQQPQISNNDKEKLEVIYRNANRMNYLINELLTFSKIEMKQMRISVRKALFF